MLDLNETLNPKPYIQRIAGQIWGGLFGNSWAFWTTPETPTTHPRGGPLYQAPRNCFARLCFDA